jgi:hypothetical protein
MRRLHEGYWRTHNLPHLTVCCELHISGHFELHVKDKSSVTRSHSHAKTVARHPISIIFTATSTLVYGSMLPERACLALL